MIRAFNETMKAFAAKPGAKTKTVSQLFPPLLRLDGAIGANGAELRFQKPLRTRSGATSPLHIAFTLSVGAARRREGHAPATGTTSRWNTIISSISMKSA
jgi:hypothetical protein